LPISGAWRGFRGVEAIGVAARVRGY